MPDQNAEIVRRLYERWTRGDFRSSADVFDPDVEFEIDAPVTTVPAKVRGIEAMGDVWREALSGWADFRVGEIDELVEVGDRVVVFNRLQGRGRVSGAVVEQADRAAIFTLRDRRVVALRLTTRSEGLKAAGSPE